MNSKNFFITILLASCFFTSAHSKIEVKSLQPASANKKSVAKLKNPSIPFKKGDLSVAYNKFGCLLFNEVFESGKNIFVSPISISLALAMTYNGAENKTKEEMAEVLNISGFDISKFNKENEKIITKLTSNKDSLKLSIANSLWAKKEEPFKKPFLETAKKFYHAEIENVDFLAPETVPRINSWVENKTQDKIKKLLKNNDVTRDTLLVLINAIYFKDKWQIQFKKDLTRKQEFYLSNGQTNQISMMSATGEYLYFEDSKNQVIQLPYSKNRLKMVIFLPSKTSSLQDFIKTFSEKKWTDNFGKFKLKKGKVLLPKFKINYKKELSNVLSKLGMSSAFGGGADFKKMLDTKISISKVLHQAFVEVNEEGTEAAAATAVIMGRGPCKPDNEFEIKVTRPFFFTIYDSESQMILFMGTVENP